MATASASAASSGVGISGRPRSIRTIDCTCDFDSLAARTEGFSGADLRIMVKEAILSALIRGHTAVEAADIEKGMEVVRNRDTIRHTAW